MVGNRAAAGRRMAGVQGFGLWVCGGHPVRFCQFLVRGLEGVWVGAVVAALVRHHPGK